MNFGDHRVDFIIQQLAIIKIIMPMIYSHNLNNRIKRVLDIHGVMNRRPTFERAA